MLETRRAARDESAAIQHGGNTLWRGRERRPYNYGDMKISQKSKPLTYGEFIMAVHDECGKRKARGIVRLAVKPHVIGVRAQQRFVIS